MNAADFKKKLKSSPRGIYLFRGEEDFLKRYCLSEARALAGGEDGAFNITRIYAAKEDGGLPRGGVIYDAVTAPPVFAEYRLCELRGVDFGALSASDTDSLLDELEEIKNTGEGILIILAEKYDAGTPKRPSKLHERLTSLAGDVTFPRESGPKLAAWIARHFAAESIACTDAVCSALVKRCGCSMDILSGEISKLCSYVKAAGRDAVGADDVSRVTCASGEFDDFALADAVMNGDAPLALRIIADMRGVRKAPPELICGSMSRTVTDMCLVGALAGAGRTAREIAASSGIHEYRCSLLLRACSRRTAEELERMARLCAMSDLRLKTTGADPAVVTDTLAACLCG